MGRSVLWCDASLPCFFRHSALCHARLVVVLWCVVICFLFFVPSVFRTVQYSTPEKSTWLRWPAFFFTTRFSFIIVLFVNLAGVSFRPLKRPSYLSARGSDIKVSYRSHTILAGYDTVVTRNMKGKSHDCVMLSSAKVDRESGNTADDASALRVNVAIIPHNYDIDYTVHRRRRFLTAILHACLYACIQLLGIKYNPRLPVHSCCRF